MAVFTLYAARTSRLPWRTRGSLTWDGALMIALWCMAALAFLWLMHGANRQGVLTGEEASVSFLDVVGTEERFQFQPYSTNFGGHLLYTIWSYIDPTFDLFFGRRWKSVSMAALAPLAYLFLRHRLHTGRTAATIGAALTVLLPGVSMVSWLAIETGLESVLGLAALLVVTSSGRIWWLGGPLAGLAVSAYAPGLPWAAAVLLAMATRVARSAPECRRGLALRGIGGTALGIAIVVFPVFFWQPTHVILVGGGGERTAAPAVVPAVSRTLDAPNPRRQFVLLLLNRPCAQFAASHACRGGSPRFRRRASRP